MQSEIRKNKRLLGIGIAILSLAVGFSGYIFLAGENTYNVRWENFTWSGLVFKIENGIQPYLFFGLLMLYISSIACIAAACFRHGKLLSSDSASQHKPLVQRKWLWRLAVVVTVACGFSYVKKETILSWKPAINVFEIERKFKKSKNVYIANITEIIELNEQEREALRAYSAEVAPNTEFSHAVLLEATENLSSYRMLPDAYYPMPLTPLFLPANSSLPVEDMADNCSSVYKVGKSILFYERPQKESLMIPYQAFPQRIQEAIKKQHSKAKERLREYASSFTSNAAGDDALPPEEIARKSFNSLIFYDATHDFTQEPVIWPVPSCSSVYSLSGSLIQLPVIHHLHSLRQKEWKESNQSF